MRWTQESSGDVSVNSLESLDSIPVECWTHVIVRIYGHELTNPNEIEVMNECMMILIL